MERPETMQDSPQQPDTPGNGPRSRHRELAVLSRANHDIRSPLSVILGVLELLEDTASLNDSERRYLQLGLKAAGELQALADSLRLYAALERGQIKLDPAPVHLAEQIREGLSEALEAKGVTVELADSGVGAALALADPGYLQLILASLGRYLGTYVPDSTDAPRPRLAVLETVADAHRVTVVVAPAGMCPQAALHGSDHEPEPDQLGVVNALRLVDLMDGTAALAPMAPSLSITLPAA